MSATRPNRQRPRPDARTLSLRELERLLRERSYLRPLPPPTPLHRMGRARLDDHQGDNINSKETTE
jgi:hypothetical protein